MINTKFYYLHFIIYVFPTVYDLIRTTALTSYSYRYNMSDLWTSFTETKSNI